MKYETYFSDPNSVNPFFILKITLIFIYTILEDKKKKKDKRKKEKLNTVHWLIKYQKQRVSSKYFFEALFYKINKYFAKYLNYLSFY